MALNKITGRELDMEELEVAHAEELKELNEEHAEELKELKADLERASEAYDELESVSQYNIEVDNLYDQLKMEELKRLFECCDLETLELL